MSDLRQTREEESAIAEAQQLGPILPVNSVYFNGFVLGLSNADMNLTLVLDGQPVTKLNLSFTTAKTLQEKLGEVVQKLEAVTKQNIMTTEQIEEGLRKLVEER